MKNIFKKRLQAQSPGIGYLCSIKAASQELTSAQSMIEAIRELGLVPFSRNRVRGLSIEEMIVRTRENGMDFGHSSTLLLFQDGCKPAATHCYLYILL